MAKIFRSFRQRLLSQNRFTRYMIYAIGEIFLVVVGILIALQLNNWNSARKNRIVEIKTLKEMRSDLYLALDGIDVNIENLATSKRCNEVVLDHYLRKLPYHDSLEYYFANLYPYVTFSPVQTTFNKLKGGGLSMISNDQLSIHIAELYDDRFNAYRTYETTYLVEHYTNYMKPMLMKEFVTFDLRVSFKPRDYDAFINNSEYRQIMNYMVENCRRFILFQEDFKEEVHALIEEIDQEIGDS